MPRKKRNFRFQRENPFFRNHNLCVREAGGLKPEITTPPSLFMPLLHIFRCTSARKQTLPRLTNDEKEVEKIMAKWRTTTRDFVRLLPKEVKNYNKIKMILLSTLQISLQILANLSGRDLLQAALVCRYWQKLSEDDLLWKEKYELSSHGCHLPEPPR